VLSNSKRLLKTFGYVQTVHCMTINLWFELSGVSILVMGHVFLIHVYTAFRKIAP